MATKKQRITISLDKNIYKDFLKICKKFEKSKSEMIENLIFDSLKNVKKSDDEKLDILIMKINEISKIFKR